LAVAPCRALPTWKLRVVGCAHAFFFVLAGRNIDVPDPIRDRILANTDLDLLHDWIDRALSATSIEQVING
jgi:hypothetical protein